MPEQAYNVADFITVLNTTLALLTSSVVGEVTELTTSARGHVYFTIKDTSQDASLPCTMWGSKYMYSGVKIEKGMEVMVTGRPEFYAPFGKLSFIANRLELVGEGALKKAYDTLKLQLEKEGVFAETKKRPIPDFAKNIGIVTSEKGAVIHDFVNNLGKNGFMIKLMHTNVEGQSSGEAIIRSLKQFKKVDIDVLVLIRGGGSMQSLSGFDNEHLVREIATYPVPVLAGVGHHQDIPLAALAADLTASTPSIVAVKLNESWDLARTMVQESTRVITEQFTDQLAETITMVVETQTRAMLILDECIATYQSIQQKLIGHILVQINIVQTASKQVSESLVAIFIQIDRQLTRGQHEITERQKYIVRLFETEIDKHKRNIIDVEKNIKSNNPERQLALGYSIARSDKGAIIRTVTDTKKGDTIAVQVSDGTIHSTVK